jgi:hypothetical protein
MQWRADRSLGIGSRRLRRIIRRVPPAPDLATSRPPGRTLMRDSISGQEAAEACRQALDADARSVAGSCDPGSMCPMRNSWSFSHHRAVRPPPPPPLLPLLERLPQRVGADRPPLLHPRVPRRLLDYPPKVGVTQRPEPAAVAGRGVRHPPPAGRGHPRLNPLLPCPSPARGTSLK